MFVRDSGLLHSLLGISNRRDLDLHPKVGASWEGFAIEEVLKALEPDEAYFWATHQGAEIDLVLFKNGRRVGVECKRKDAPDLTTSMRTALNDLKLDRLIVVYPGDQRYQLTDGVEVIPLNDIVGPNADPARFQPKSSLALRCTICLDRVRQNDANPSSRHPQSQKATRANGDLRWRRSRIT